MAAIALLAAFTVARPREAPGAPLRDFQAYYSAGQTWISGRDPYSVAIWQAERNLPGANAQRFELLPFVGPPATLPLWAAFARLHYADAANLWRAVLVLSLIALAWCVLTLCRMRRRPFVALAIAIAVLGFGPVTSAFALGQLALPGAALTTLTVIAPPALGWLTAAFAFAQPNIALALTGELRERRPGASVIFGLVVFTIGCVAVAGFNGAGDYLRNAAAHRAAEAFAAIQTTPAAIAYGFGATETAANAVGIACAATAIAVWVVCLVRIRDRTALFCLSACLLPFAMPFFHEHDLAVLFVPAAILVARAPRAVSPLALAGALLCGVNWLNIAERPDSALQSILLATALATSLLLLRSEMNKLAAGSVAAVVILIAIAGFAANAYPMPVWPQAATAHFITGSPPAAVVWREELLATGLIAHERTWALLRCTSLLGAALLACCAILRPQFLESQSAGFGGGTGGLKAEFSQ